MEVAAIVAAPVLQSLQGPRLIAPATGNFENRIMKAGKPNNFDDLRTDKHVPSTLVPSTFVPSAFVPSVFVSSGSGAFWPVTSC